MSKEIVLVGACRTAIGKMGGALSTVPAEQLGAIVMKEAMNRAGIAPSRLTKCFSAMCSPQRWARILRVRRLSMRAFPTACLR